ncbi:ABC transporter substrate-binding protein [Roseomonas sp. BN140053]|uniref:ABC transporter substrate-binding protein n=1 Tax=Roseomonas sp. BN140053 TaxID=3391898 RepID=UPI0039E89249
MGSFTRRDATRLIAGAGAALGGGLAAPAVWGQSGITKLRVGLVPVLDAGGFFMAQVQGHFARERLEIEVTPTPGGGPSIAALVAGQFQFSMSTVTTMISAAAEGVDIRLVTAVSGARPAPEDYSGILVRKDSGIRTGKDVVGKTGASHLLQNLPWICARLWIDNTGGDSSRARIIEVQFPQQQDALLGNRVDYVATNEPFMSAALHAAPDRLEVVSGLLGTMLPNTIVAAFAASGDYINKNRAVVDSFVGAYAQGAAWAQNNKSSPELVEQLARFTRIAPERLRAMIAWPDYPRVIDPANLERIAQAMKRYGSLPTVPDMGKLIHTTARA